MKYINAIKNWIDGRKTYAVATAGMLTLLVGWSGGSVGNAQAIQDAVGLLLTVTMRHAVSKSSATATEHHTHPNKGKHK